MFLIISFFLLEGSSSKKRTCVSTRNLDLLGMKLSEKESNTFQYKRLSCLSRQWPKTF